MPPSPEVLKHWFQQGYDAQCAGTDLYGYPQRIAEGIPTPQELIDVWKDGWKTASLGGNREGHGG